MAKSFDPHVVVTPQLVLFSRIVHDAVERIRVPRDLIDRAQGRPLADGEAWALIADRMVEIGCARELGAGTLASDDASSTNLDWMKLLGPR